MLPFIEQWRYRRWQRRHAEMVLAANLTVREIKRNTIRQLLDSERRAPVIVHDDVIDSTPTTIPVSSRAPRSRSAPDD